MRRRFDRDRRIYLCSRRSFVAHSYPRADQARGGAHSERHTASLWKAAQLAILGGLDNALSLALYRDRTGKSTHGRLAAAVQVFEALDAAAVCGGGFVDTYAACQKAAVSDFVLRSEILREVIKIVFQ